MGGPEVWSRTPLRLGLIGGGTDLREFSSDEGGLVINATIDRFVYVRISQGISGETEFLSYDTEEQSTLSNSEIQGNMPLFRTSLYRVLELSDISEEIPLRIESFSDSPVGSGLGTSSSLCVGLIKALAEWFEVNLDNHQIAELAYKVEREDCGFSGGMQDQYAATFGGINLMTFNPDGSVIVDSLNIDDNVKNTIQASIVLFFTGISRDSSLIIDQQSTGLKSEENSARAALEKMKSLVPDFRDSLLNGDIYSMSEIMNSCWDEKKRTSNAVSNPSIDSLILDAQINGALSAKISGAGGGGFALFIVPFEKRNRLINWLRSNQGIVMTCTFSEGGSRSWTT